MIRVRIISHGILVGGDVGASLGDGVDPGVDDEAAAFVLDSS